MTSSLSSTVAFCCCDCPPESSLFWQQESLACLDTYVWVASSMECCLSGSLLFANKLTDWWLIVLAELLGLGGCGLPCNSKKGVYSSSRETISRVVECHQPYSMTQCYLPPNRWTCPASPQPDRPVVDLPTSQGWKAELTWLAWLNTKTTYPQMVNHPSTNRARRRATSLIETNALPLAKLSPMVSNVYVVVRHLQQVLMI